MNIQDKLYDLEQRNKVISITLIIITLGQLGFLAYLIQAGI